MFRAKNQKENRGIFALQVFIILYDENKLLRINSLEHNFFLSH